MSTVILEQTSGDLSGYGLECAEESKRGAQEIWTKVEGARRGPGSVCDLCGRQRERQDLSTLANPARPGDLIFRRVRINGAAESITVCGRCLREHMPS